jgi:hypothetical protein
MYTKLESTIKIKKLENGSITSKIVQLTPKLSTYFNSNEIVNNAGLFDCQQDGRFLVLYDDNRIQLTTYKKTDFTEHTEILKQCLNYISEVAKIDQIPVGLRISLTKSLPAGSGIIGKAVAEPKFLDGLGSEVKPMAVAYRVLIDDLEYLINLVSKKRGLEIMIFYSTELEKVALLMDRIDSLSSLLKDRVFPVLDEATKSRG